MSLCFLRIIKLGIKLISITDGPNGSIISDGTTIVNSSIYKGDVQDTTGAGDQYAAGVLAGRAMGMSWQDAGRLGSTCASEVISHYGARPETPIHELVVDGVKRL